MVHIVVPKRERLDEGESVIVYRDRQFCSQSRACANAECARWLSPFHEQRARELRMSVAYADHRTPTCGFAAVERR